MVIVLLAVSQLLLALDLVLVVRTQRGLRRDVEQLSNRLERLERAAVRP